MGTAIYRRPRPAGQRAAGELGRRQRQAPADDDEVVEAEIVDEDDPARAAPPDAASEETDAGPVIRDLRRIDPVTGQVAGSRGRDAAGTAAGAGRAGRGLRVQAGGAAERPAPAGAPGRRDGPTGRTRPPGGRERRRGPRRRHEARPAGRGRVEARLAERTADLQRVQAEYANYRKRVDRDRVAVREQALANVLVALLPVLDDIGRAREHGELTGGFKSVAESLESTLTKLGLVSFGRQVSRSTRRCTRP